MCVNIGALQAKDKGNLEQQLLIVKHSKYDKLKFNQVPDVLDKASKVMKALSRPCGNYEAVSMFEKKCRNCDLLKYFCDLAKSDAHHHNMENNGNECIFARMSIARLENAMKN